MNVIMNEPLSLQLPQLSIPSLPSQRQQEEQPQRKPLSPAARQKVSFEDESQCFFDFTTFFKQDYDYDQSSSVLKEDKRVVSTDTIGTPVSMSVPVPTSALGCISAPVPAAKSAFHLTMRKNKSKSLSSLTRSGNLKSLVEQSQNCCFNSKIPTPAVSEDCLSSSIQNEDMSMVNLHSSFNSTYDNSGSCSFSQQQQDQITESSPTSSTNSSSTMPDHVSCTGWGQFVDFIMPSERVETSSSRVKLRSPTTRRRSVSFSSSKHSTKYKLQKFCKDQTRRHNMQKSSNYNHNHNYKMYNKKNNSLPFSISTESSDTDMVHAFKNKLSITQK